MDNQSSTSADNNLQYLLDTRNYFTHFHTLHSTNPIMQQFLIAIQDSNFGDLNKLLETHGHITDDLGLTPLKISIYGDNYQAVKKIISFLGYILPDPTLLSLCCEFCNDCDILSELLKCQNCNVNMRGGSIHETPLNYAIQKGKNNFVILLLETKLVDISLTNNYGLTPLVYAIYNKMFEIATLMMKNTNKLTFNDMEAVILRGSAANVEYLIKNHMIKNEQYGYLANLLKRSDINIDIFKEYIDTTLIKDCIYSCIFDIIKNNDILKLDFILSCQNIDFSICNESGMNPLIYSISQNNLNMVKKIIDYLKNVNYENIINQKDYNGLTAFLMASKCNSDQIFELLYKSFTFDVNAAEYTNKTALHYAIEKNNTAIFDLLLGNQEIDINVQDDYGETPIMYVLRYLNTSSSNNFLSASSKYNYYFNQLINHQKINLDLANNLGYTPLYYMLLKKYNLSSCQVEEKKDPYCNDLAGLYPFCYNYEMTTCDKKNNDDYDNLILRLVHKSNPNCEDLIGKTLMQLVIENKDSVLFNILLDKVNLNYQSIDGKTYLMIILDKILNKNSTAEKIVPQQKNNINDWLNNVQPVVYSALDKQLNCTTTVCPKIDCQDIYLSFFIKLLKHNNVDITKTDFDGHNILMMVSSSDYINLLKIILETKKIDIDTQNHIGKSAFMLAVENKKWHNVKLLYNHQAKTDLMDHNGKKCFEYLVNRTDLVMYHKIVDGKEQSKKSWFY